MNYNEEEQIQLQWINEHPIEDKDRKQKKEKPFLKTTRSNKKRRKGSIQDLPFGEPEQEIDLHGCEGLEAVEKVDSLIHAMIPSGYRVLRIIHGGGHSSYGNVKRFVDHHIKTKLKHLVEYYSIERNNAGSSILKIKSDVEKAPLLKKALRTKAFLTRITPTTEYSSAW